LSSNFSVQKSNLNIGKLRKIEFEKKISGEHVLQSRINFISGELNFSPITTGHIYEFSYFYNIPETKPIIDYTVTDNIGLLSIHLRSFQKLGVASRSHWNIGLHTNIINQIDVESKTSVLNFNLSDIPIQRINIQTGASKINMYFNKPNPVVMDFLTVYSAASDCRFYGLLNARAEKIEVHNGTGNLYMDFSGEQIKTSRVVIIGGIGFSKIVIPQNINAKLIFKDRISTSIKIDGFYKIAENQYRSKDFNEKSPFLMLEVSIGTGRLEVANTAVENFVELNE